MALRRIRLLQIDFVFFLMTVLLVLTSCLGLTQNFYPELTQKENVSPSVHSCAGCHIDIYEEWKNSPHAKAFTSETYRERTNNYQYQQCLSCHTPDSVFSDTILARKERLEEGVSCIACHFIDGKFAGPVESTAVLLVHPVEVRTDFYRSSALCGKCHESTYQEWLSVDSLGKKICQECHMTPVVRSSTQGDNLISNMIVSFEEQGHFKRHKFHLSEIENLEGGVEVLCSSKGLSSQEQEIHLT
ncbi:MAG: multiheme c-type cytochrome, partial [Planctomycetota bacterium]